MFDTLIQFIPQMHLRDVSLFVLTTLTSTIAGIFGLGGGLILAVTLPWFVPANAVVPIHGTTQLASNFSRLLFAYQHVVWSLVPKFVVGSIAGVALFTLVLSNMPTKYIPVAISVYLLLSLWVNSVQSMLNKIESFYLVGMIQTGLGLVVGAPGPLTITLLMKKLDDREQIVATASVLMGLVNLAKVVTYATIGFIFWDYLSTIIWAIGGAFLGSFIGTKLRGKFDHQRFINILKWILTLLALQTLIRFGFF